MKTKEEIDLLLQEELETIVKLREICKTEVVNHLKSNAHNTSCLNGQKRYLDIVERALNAEIEYLMVNPMDYYQIYLDEEFYLST